LLALSWGSDGKMVTLVETRASLEVGVVIMDTGLSLDEPPQPSSQLGPLPFGGIQTDQCSQRRSNELDNLPDRVAPSVPAQQARITVTTRRVTVMRETPTQIGAQTGGQSLDPLCVTKRIEATGGGSQIPELSGLVRHTSSVDRYEATVGSVGITSQ
jgi:hypothetical protein